MNNRTFSADTIVTAVLWTLVGAFVIAAWALFLTGHQGTAIMVALTGCPVVAAALAGQIRCYTRRICGLVRATRTESNDAGIHSLR